jgi:hypothetical protein
MSRDLHERCHSDPPADGEESRSGSEGLPRLLAVRHQRMADSSELQTRRVFQHPASRKQSHKPSGSSCRRVFHHRNHEVWRLAQSAEKRSRRATARTTLDARKGAIAQHSRKERGVSIRALGVVARASRPLWRGHHARALLRLVLVLDRSLSQGSRETCRLRERDAPATAGETPALQTLRRSRQERPKPSTFMPRALPSE